MKKNGSRCDVKNLFLKAYKDMILVCGQKIETNRLMKKN